MHSATVYFGPGFRSSSRGSNSSSSWRVSEKSVIQATDVKTIYEIPKIYMQNGFDTEVLASMNIKKPRKIKTQFLGVTVSLKKNLRLFGTL